MQDPSKQQTNREQLCTIVVRREKRNKKTQTIDHPRQFNHDMSTRTAPCGRGHVCASNDTTEGHIWPQESVSRTSLIAQACGTHAHNFSIKK
jgi:hypothetical protein